MSELGRQRLEHGGLRSLIAAGAVDLTPHKDPAKYKHRWIYAVNFAVDEKTMASIAEQTLRAKRRHEKGLDATEGSKAIPLNLTQENIVAQEGPGCAKCQLFWELAYKDPCTVSDDAYDAAGSPTVTGKAHPDARTQPVGAAYCEHPRLQPGGACDDCGTQVTVLKGL